MKNYPLVSIVIPVYNVEHYIRTCLESVRNQSYQNIEVVCVNDGSPDDSLRILKEYEKNDFRFKVIDIENRGLSGARNVGTNNCNGEYIMYLDSDDWIDTDTIEISVSYMIENQVDVVLWNYRKEYGIKSVPVKVFKELRIVKNNNFNLLYRRLIGLIGEELKHPELCDSISTAWGKLYKKNLIQRNNIEFVDIKEIGTEDLLFNVEYFKYCDSAVCLPKCLNHYRKNNYSSLTKKYKPLLFEQWSEMQRRICSLVGDNKDLLSALNNRICLSIIGLGLNEINSDEPFSNKRDKIKNILNEERYKKAFSKLQLTYFPIHWKIFFYCAKKKLVSLLILQLLTIRYILTK